jgi:phosphoglycolate phosphatase-like HAD superfamily hydrolase
VSLRHIVWDWNGTLLDDLRIVIEAVNVSLSRLGRDPIDEDGYRDHFTRPVRAFYDSLFGRAITDDEWELLNNGFHREYFGRADQADLTADTVDALTVVDGLGWGQSLLSMSPQEWLEQITEAKGVKERFALVDGLRVPTGGLKAKHMEEHLEVLDVDPSRTVVVGDTPDDAVAARHVGAQVVLYDGGSHHLPRLRGMGAPVAHSLLEAVEIAATL